MAVSSHLWRMGAGLTGLGFVICLPVIAGLGEADMGRRDSRQAAIAFFEHVEVVIATLPVEREHVEIRINRCEGTLGEMRDDVYAIWVGTRLVAEQDDADRMLLGVLDDWLDRGWEITRKRVLDNGGINIAAVDRVSGNTYSLDSGFDPQPRRHIVGYFSTPCLQDPSGTAPFGSMEPQ